MTPMPANKTWLAMIFLAIPPAAWGEDLPLPAGPVVLTVSGKIEQTNVEETAQFDLEMLRAIDDSTIVTSTIWTQGQQTFRGISLAALVRALGASGQTLQASAVNDYTVDIPLTDAVHEGPIMAYSRNGTILSLRDKGPLWVIYPYDDSTNYRSDVIFSRSIWQLDRIEVVD